MDENYILARVKDACIHILSHKLVGIYVHGSIALGCFSWDTGDIDFLIVVSSELNQSEKEALISAFLEIDGYCPPKGLEMSVLLRKNCRPFVYPTPFELHFSNLHKPGFIRDISGYCRTLHGSDSDLAAHITVINRTGIVLWGRSIETVFSPVPRPCYIDSIISDITDSPKEIFKTPAHCTLNLCRTLSYLKDGEIRSKKQGGQWGLSNLPHYFSPIISAALYDYETGCGFTGSFPLEKFSQYMLSEILSAAGGEGFSADSKTQE